MEDENAPVQDTFCEGNFFADLLAKIGEDQEEMLKTFEEPPMSLCSSMAAGVVLIRP